MLTMLRTSYFRTLLTSVVAFAAACIFAIPLHAGPKPGYQSFIVGNPADAPPSMNLSPGLALMGGGTDVDAAFQWMCQRAGGGDFVVIRTTGTDAYNPYIQGLCPQMDSVETIIITTVTGANSAYVTSHIQNAEALWIAGGDQSTYMDLWRGTAVQSGVNYLLNSKLAPVGGTSAGLAVLSQFIYTGALGSVTSSQALANPFHRYVTLDRDLFQSSLGANQLYDSHFVTRDRMGRSLAFLARIVNNGWATQPRGIGIDEQTAILVLPNGAGTMVGSGAAYFLQAPGPAQVLAAKTPLTYLNIGVYKVPQGGTFNLSSWTGTGGVAYTLNVNAGALTSTQAGGSIY
ncbi:MAG TPA: cyanophycinase [Pyrinomonadaceae bacterium]|jgi:cyanophycinase-like exopeptidase|nr:cyanophycinase [Pyrinomonadaceae bacterium]